MVLILKDYGNYQLLSFLWSVEQFLPDQKINEVKIRGKQALSLNIEKQPRRLNLSFAFTDTWDDDLIHKVAR